MAFQTVVHAATSDPEESARFYKKLNFELLSDDDAVIFTDGKALVEVNPDRYARNGIKLYGNDFSTIISRVEEVAELILAGDGFISSDPNGVRVYFSETEANINFKPKNESFGMTGNFAGLSIEAHDIDATVEFWEAVGFEKSQGDIEQGWATFSNGSSIDLSIMKPLMCPHLFFNPGMTYFNGGKNLTNIGLIREAGIPIIEEITHFNTDGVADNAIIRDPGGLGFFIFND